MEIPDVLVVTKADLGQVAHAGARGPARRRCARWARRDTAVLAVSSVAPPTGIDELVDALDAHRAGLDLPARRLRAPPDARARRLRRRARRARPAGARRPARGRALAAGPAGPGARRARARAPGSSDTPGLAGDRSPASVAALTRLGRIAADPCARIVAPGRAAGRRRHRAAPVARRRPRRRWSRACQDPEIIALDARARGTTARPTPAPICCSATTRVAPGPRHRSRSSRPATAQLLGSISLMRLDWEHARGEVGYWLARDARGRATPPGRCG